MGSGNPILDKAVAVASTLVVRGDGRCFCRPSSTTSLVEVTPRVGLALRLAQKAAPHLQRQVLLERKLAMARSLGAEDAGAWTRRTTRKAMESIPVEVRSEFEALMAAFEAEPPTEAERQVLEAAAVGTWSEPSA